MKKLILYLFLFLILVISVTSSPGGTDSNGCHNSKKEGYHCHGSSRSSITSASSSFSSNSLTTSTVLVDKNGFGGNCTVSRDCVNGLQCVHSKCSDKPYYINDNICDSHVGENYIISKDCNPNINEQCEPYIRNETCFNTKDCSCGSKQVCDIKREGTLDNGCYDIKCGDGFIDNNETSENCCVDVPCGKINSMFKTNKCSSYSQTCFVGLKSGVYKSIFISIFIGIVLFIIIGVNRSNMKKTHKG